MGAPVEVIFEDDAIVVVNKPAGLATQAPRQFDSLEARLRTLLADRAHPVTYLGIPHRLDRCVSGVMVFAKRKKSAQRLSKQFERREVRKTYSALVHGQVASQEGTWVDWIRKVPEEPRAETVPESSPDGRRAVLHYQCRQASPRQSELAIELETGRMHQIRLQCGTRGHPVVGDVLYGSDRDLEPRPAHERDRRIALHARRIGFVHPRTKEAVTFDAPFPAHYLEARELPDAST